MSRARPNLTLDRSGDYLIELSVTDETGLTQANEYALSVAPCGEGQPTLALSASDQTPSIGQWVTLTALGQDPDSAEAAIVHNRSPIIG